MMRGVRLTFVAGLVLLAASSGRCAAVENSGGEKQPSAGASQGASEGGDAPAPVGGSSVALDLLAAESDPGYVMGPRRTRASADSWLKLMADFARSDSGAHTSGTAATQHINEDWFPRPIPVSLPIGRSGSSLPVLILPVPVPADSPAQCSADAANARPYNDQYIVEEAPHSRPSLPIAKPAPSVTKPLQPVDGRGAPPQWKAKNPQGKNFVIEVPAPPKLDYVVSSQQLVELFQAQVAANSELPPLLIPDYTAGQSSAFTGAVEEEGEEDNAEGVRRTRHVRIRRYQLPVQSPVHRYQLPVQSPVESEPQALAPGLHGATPPTPRIERSLLVRGELTVPRSGYTEPYTVWWDARTGGARVDLHGGATSAYRMILPDGRVQGVQMKIDRSGDGGDVRRCLVEAPRAPETADLAVPAFPDMTEFKFAGYSQAEFGRVERWTHTVSGHPGELGGARGEALTFRHEMVVARAPDNYTTTPLRYSVSVDSSVLGPDCDGYVHRYTELRDQHHDPAVLHLDLEETCEVTEPTQRRTDPLREYTLPHRDPQHDKDFQSFKNDFKRQYLDNTEEAVRKTLMVQSSRFVASGNREGATSVMKVNYLGDRLDAELALLNGVQEDAEGLQADRFPHSRDQLTAMRGSLPRAFDWRQRGAVTHVRNQGSCSSCWAFSVTGAVEGALFVRTRRLVPLSEQALVDCAQPFGGHGCGNTWPSAAYDYVQERGLPALTHYTPYQAKTLTCLDRRVPPVTHISSHVNVTRDSITALKVAIRRHGPTVVIVATPNSFTFHSKGVLYDDRCPKRKAEHAVLAVGWGEHRGETYFILKNSWSTAWGEDGYIRVSAASNTCGVMSRPSYPRLEREDVDEAAATAPTETVQD